MNRQKYFFTLGFWVELSQILGLGFSVHTGTHWDTCSPLTAHLLPGDAVPLAEDADLRELPGEVVDRSLQLA